MSGTLWDSLRPYSWPDMLILVPLAHSFAGDLALGGKDLLAALILFILWIYFNLSLERKHDYPRRKSLSRTYSSFLLIVALLLALLSEHPPLTALFSAVLLIEAYLLKSIFPAFALASVVVRALIQLSFLWLALSSMRGAGNDECLLLPSICLLGLAVVQRSAAGDIRDRVHNREDGKRTLAVLLQERQTAVLMLGISMIGASVAAICLGPMPAAPFAVMGAAVIKQCRGFYLHQLSILNTTFLSIFLISVNLHQSAFLPFLGYLTPVALFCFYEDLFRRSNPNWNFSTTACLQRDDHRAENCL